MSQADASKITKDVFTPSFAGVAQGGFSCGVENNLLSTMRWQQSGSRLIVTASPYDVGQFTEDESLPAILNGCRLAPPRP